jgi:hypothetical protein
LLLKKTRRKILGKIQKKKNFKSNYLPVKISAVCLNLGWRGGGSWGFFYFSWIPENLTLLDKKIGPGKSWEIFLEKN